MAEDNLLEALQEKEDEPEEVPRRVHELDHVDESKTDKCWIAMKAAMETVGEYCGGAGNIIEVGGLSIKVPQSLRMYVIQSGSSIPRDELINTVMAEPWTQERATEVCEELLRFESGTHECNKCVESTAKQLAERIVSSMS